MFGPMIPEPPSHGNPLDALPRRFAVGFCGRRVYNTALTFDLLRLVSDRMAEKINVVFMAQVQYPHGMAGTRRIQNFVDYLHADQRFQLQMLILRGGRVRLADEPLSGEHRGVPYVTIGAGIRPGFGALLKAPKYYYDGIAYLRRHRRADCKNVLYVYGYPSTDNLPMLIAAGMAGWRIVFDLVEDIAVQPSAPDMLARLKLYSARLFSGTMRVFADAVVAISKHLHDKALRIARSSFEVLHYPINVRTDEFDFPPPAFDQPVQFFYGGTFGEKDGVENLIAAFEKVCAARPDVNLVLTGVGSPDRMDAVLARIAASPCRHRILYKGYLAGEDFHGQLQAADILCATRTGSQFARTGFPFKLGEYLATGRPVVASNVGDANEYLQDKKNAMLVEPDEVQQIAEKLEWLIAHPDEARRIGLAGREAAAAHFDYRVVGEKLKHLLLKI